MDDGLWRRFIEITRPGKLGITFYRLGVSARRLILIGLVGGRFLGSSKALASRVNRI
jgi:hypothetical protein